MERMDHVPSVKTEVKEYDDQDTGLELYSVIAVGKEEYPPAADDCKTEPTEEEEVTNVEYKSEIEPEINQSLPTMSSDLSCDKPPDPVEMVCIKTEEHECTVHPNISPEDNFLRSECGQSQKEKFRKRTKKRKKLPPIDPKLASTKVYQGRKIYQCGICPYNSSKMNDLRKHILKHSGEKPHVCSVCLSSFTQASSLQTHLLRHSSEKAFKCKSCPYSSVYASAFTIHLRTHTGEKPYGCRVCAYACSNSSALKTHMMTHSGLKPYLCHICPDRFSHPTSLKNHICKHTKPFQCDMCGYRCSQKGHLSQHVERNHGGQKRFGCAHCRYRAITKQELGNHLSRKHAQR